MADDWVSLVLVALVLALSAWMLSRSQHANQPNGMQGAFNRQTPVDPSATARAGHCKLIQSDTLTPAQKKMHAHLPLRAGVRPITMSGNLLLDHASPPAFNEAAVATVVDLIAVSDVFLLFRVQNEEHKRDILQAIGQIPQFAWNPTTQMGLQVHKILFCSSSAGNIALVRQIEPVVHIEGKQDVTVGLRPFLPSIVFLSPIYELPAQTSSTGRDSVEWHQSLDAYYLTLTA